jgi:hypothetical protein
MMLIVYFISIKKRGSFKIKKLRENKHFILKFQFQNKKTTLNDIISNKKGLKKS